jgi:hypothetical protein
MRLSLSAGRISTLGAPGDFHPDNSGVYHFGFVAESLRDIFAGAGFADVRARIAYTVHKQVASGETKEFPILLLTAVKR